MKKKALPIRKVKDYLKILKDSNLTEAIAGIQKDALDKIQSANTRKTYREYSEKLIQALGIRHSNKKTMEPEETPEHKKAKDNLNGFFDNIITQKIPIVSILGDEERRYQILCYRHLSTNSEVDNFDVKRIFHESPTTFVIIGVAAYIVPLFSALYYSYSQLLKTQKSLLDIEKAKLEIKKAKKSDLETALLEAHIKTIQATMDTASLVESKYKMDVTKDIDLVESEDLKNNLNRCLEYIQKEYIDLISAYQLQFQTSTEI